MPISNNGKPADKKRKNRPYACQPMAQQLKDADVGIGTAAGFQHYAHRRSNTCDILVMPEGGGVYIRVRSIYIVVLVLGV